MGEYTKEMEREYQRYSSIKRDYFTVLNLVQQLEKTGIDSSVYKQGLEHLEEKFIQARLSYNMIKSDIKAQETKNEQIQRDRTEAELQNAIEKAA